jgi:hypothetical protein
VAVLLTFSVSAPIHVYFQHFFADSCMAAVLHCTALYLHCTALHCTALHCTALHLHCA